MKKFIVLLFLITVFLNGCDWFAMDRYYSICFKNNSESSIAAYFTRPFPEPDPFYPDTSLANKKPSLLEIPRNEKRYWNISYEYKYLFDAIPSDTISVFIFHADTINKFTWDEVRDGYKVLKRYDLSLKDLETMNWTITYP